MNNETSTETTKQISGSDIKAGMIVLRRVKGMGMCWIAVTSVKVYGDKVEVLGRASNKLGSWPVAYTTGADAGVIQKVG